MTQPISLLEELRDGSLEACVISTYSIHLPFFEHIVLPRLAAAGCRHIALFVDAAQCSHSLQDPSAAPRLAGSDYALLPIRMPGAAAFHPKIMMLGGAKGGRLFIGSHNLTLAGFVHNREITNRIVVDGRSDDAGVANVRTALNGLLGWAGALPVATQAYLANLQKALPWLGGPRPAATVQTDVVVSTPTGHSLWDLVRVRVTGQVTRAMVVGAFFDEGLEFLTTLQRNLEPRELIVGIHPRSVMLNVSRARKLSRVRFVDAGRLSKGRGYLHAKAVGLSLLGGGEILISGSANPSRPAWTAGGTGRNAEAVVVRIAARGESLLDDLGLSSLADSEEIEDESWSEIERSTKERNEARQDGQPSRAMLAVRDGDAYLLDESALPASMATAVSFHVGARRVAAAAGPFSTRDGLLRLPSQPGTPNPSLLVLVHQSKQETFCVPYHAAELVSRAQSGTQRALRAAIASLDGATPQIEELLKIVEKVVFHEGGGTQSPAVGPGGPRAPKPDASTGGSTASLAANLDEVSRRHNHHRRHVLSDDLIALLDALIRRLFTPADASGRNASLDGEAPENEPSEPADLPTNGPQKVDGEALAALCRKKVNLLLNRRLIPRLEIAAEDLAAESFRTVTQAAAVLSVVRAVCALELAPPSPLPRYARLVDREGVGKFVWKGAGLLCSSRMGILPGALAELKVTVSEEVSIVRGLLLWMACLSAIDRRWATEGEDREAIQDKLLAVADLLAISRQCLNDPIAIKHAEDAFGRTFTERARPGAFDWMRRHLAWAASVQAAARARRILTADQRAPQPGDVVVLTRGETSEPYLVVRATPERVTIADAEHDDGLRAIGLGYAAVLDLREARAAVA